MDFPSDSRPRSESDDRQGAVEEIVTIPIEHYGDLFKAASSEGVQIEKLEDFNLVDPESISVILLGTSLAVSTVAYLVEQWRGGQVFDLRVEAKRPAYRSKDIVFGLVEIIAVDGSVSVEVKEPKGMFGQVLDTLAPLIHESVGTAARPLKKRLEDVLGDAASVEAKI